MSIEDQLVWDQTEEHPRYTTDMVLATWWHKAAAYAAPPEDATIWHLRTWLGMTVGVLSSVLGVRILSEVLDGAAHSRVMALLNQLAVPLIAPFEGMLPDIGYDALTVSGDPLAALAAVWLLYGLFSAFLRAID